MNKKHIFIRNDSVKNKLLGDISEVLGILTFKGEKQAHHIITVDSFKSKSIQDDIKTAYHKGRCFEAVRDAFPRL